MTTKLAALVTVFTLLTGGAALAGDSTEAHRAGCWETVVQAIKKTSRPELRDMDVKLPNAGSVHVRYSANAGKHGLALIMCGTFGTTDNPYSNDLARDLMQSGYNVLLIDSFFSTRFVSQAKSGAPGNLRAEALLAGQIAQEFMHSTGNTQDLSVVGVSYGGGVALQMAALEKENKLAVRLSHVLAISVPVSFRESMRLLDSYENEPYSYDKIIPIVNAAKPDSAVPSKTCAGELEKVIGRGFRLDLGKTVDLVDRMYAGQISPVPGKALNLESLSNPRAEKMEREVEADAMTFGMLFHYWLAPYWSCKGGVNADELLGYGELSRVLPAVSGKVELVIARNDPLNDEGAADELRSIKTEAKVTVLPSGGHAGFVRTTEMKSIVNRIFAESVAQVSARR